MSFIDWLSDRIDRICTVALITIMTVMLGCLTVLIFGRNFFGFSLPELEELSRYSLVWMTFIGGTMVYRRNEHMAFDFVIVKFLRGKIQSAALFLKDLLTFGIILCMVYYGFEFVGRSIHNSSLQIPISMAYVYLVIPLSGLMMFVHAIKHLIYRLEGKVEEIKDKVISE